MLSCGLIQSLADKSSVSPILARPLSTCRYGWLRRPRMGALGIPMTRIHQQEVQRTRESAGPSAAPLWVRTSRTWTPEIESSWALASNLREAIAAKPPHHVPFDLRVHSPRTEIQRPCSSRQQTAHAEHHCRNGFLWEVGVSCSVAATLLASLAFGFSAAFLSWLALRPRVSRL